MCQRKYALEILQDCGLLATKFPLEPNVKLSCTEGVLLEDSTKYRRLISCLLYLIIARPDLAYYVKVLRQFIDHPCQPHPDAAQRVLCCIKATSGQGLFFFF